MPDLERELRALGADLEQPPTPPLAARVTARLEQERRPARAARRSGWRRPLLIAAIAALVAGATAMAASRSVRDAVLDTLGIGGVEVESIDGPPPAVEPRPLDLGTPTTLAGARDSLSFAPVVPLGLGPPDAVFTRPEVPGGELSLVYEPSPALAEAAVTGVGLLVTEFRGDLLDEYLRKVVTQATTVERVRVAGHRGAWISGAPHFFFYGDPEGEPVERDLEVAQNVLLIDRGRLLVRLEGAMGRERALRIGASLTPR